LRISLGGGGTDLPSYYREFGGFLIAAAIDKSVYVSVHATFQDELVVRYSKIERVQSPSELHHPIVREALRALEIPGRHLEITSMADIPAGTGLGSSGSFGTALLKALYRFRRKVITPAELAEAACHIEIDLLKEPIGKQDPYAAAFGGINCYEFRPDDSVLATPLALSDSALAAFRERVLVFCTGLVRAAPAVLRDQDDQTRKRSPEMLANLHFMKQIGHASKVALEAGDLDEFGHLLHEHWERKRSRSHLVSNARIDHWYDAARTNGAAGGKVIGAGGGGFFMFVADDPTRLRKAFAEEGLRELVFNFDFDGTRILQ